MYFLDDPQSEIGDPYQEKEMTPGFTEGVLEPIGQGLIRPFSDINRAATIGVMGANRVLGGVQKFFGNEPGVEHTKERQKSFDSFYQDWIKPAHEFWKPDPHTTTMAGQIIGDLVGIAPFLMFGLAAPAVMAGSAFANTGQDLIEQGVDDVTALKAGITAGVGTGLLTTIPMAGKTIAHTLGLMLLNPFVGAAERQIIKNTLDERGYKDLAKGYDPFDPYSMGIDTFMGALFGGYHHLTKALDVKLSKRVFDAQKKALLYNINDAIEKKDFSRFISSLPTQVEDAITIARQHESAIKSTMFDPAKPGMIGTHLDALNKALTDLGQDRPVDVSEQVKGVTERKQAYPDSYNRQALDQEMQGYVDSGKIMEEQKGAYIGMLEANARANRMDFDVYLSKRFAGFKAGEKEAGKRGSTEVKPLEQTYQKYGNTITKGAVSFLEDGRAVIHAFEGADFSTLVHETGHVFRRNLPGHELKILESEYKIKNGKWERSDEESFAKGFERYLTEGNAPTPELQGMFEKFKQWMLDVYRNIVGDSVWNTKLSPEVRKVMDRLFIESEIPLKKNDTPEQMQARKTVAESTNDLDEIHKKMEDEGYITIPQEKTVTEDWGTGETVMGGREVKSEKAGKRGSAEVKADLKQTVTTEPLKPSKEHLEYIKEWIDQGEAGGRNFINNENAPGREVVGFSSTFPEWFKNKGYNKKDAMKIVQKYMDGKALTEKQQEIFNDLVRSSEREYRKFYELDDPTAKYVEETIFQDGKDYQIVTGTDVSGKEVMGSAKEAVDKARIELINEKKKENAFTKISKCITG